MSDIVEKMLRNKKTNCQNSSVLSSYPFVSTTMTKNRKKEELIERAERLKVAIATLNSQIQKVKALGDIAPPKCYVLRYQARGKEKTYYYYKLHATLPIFTTNSGKKSKYKHLGKAGTLAHVNAVMQVARRSQIDGLQRAVDSLTESWQNLNQIIENQHHQQESSIAVPKREINQMGSELSVPQKIQQLT